MSVIYSTCNLVYELLTTAEPATAESATAVPAPLELVAPAGPSILKPAEVETLTQ